MKDDAPLASDAAADAASALPLAERRISGVSLGLLAGTLALSLASGCREEDPPAARLSGSPVLVRLAYPECVPYRFEWTPLAPLRRADMHPTVFVHLIDRPNHVLRTFDHDLPGPWTVGVTRRDDLFLCQSALGPPLPRGTYALTAGLYDPALGYRWHLSTGGPDVTGHREYRVASVEAPPGRSGDARFRFSEGWSAVEPGGDQQVLQRRSLSGSGTILIEPSPLVRTIRIQIRVAPGSETAARVAASCAVSIQELPPGSRSFEATPVPGEPCEIRLEKIQTGGSPAAPAQRWLALESLALRRLGG